MNDFLDSLRHVFDLALFALLVVFLYSCVLVILGAAYITRGGRLPTLSRPTVDHGRVRETWLGEQFEHRGQARCAPSREEFLRDVGFGRYVDGCQPPTQYDRAADLLHVQLGAPEAVVEAAYRQLTKAAHPDQGGTAELFRALKEARDLLVDGVRVR